MILLSNDSYANLQNEQALFINRIADFWQEQDFVMAKHQILEFLQIYPDSPYCHHFYAALGDLYLDEGDYSKALAYYDKVQAPETKEKILQNKIQCYFALKNYDLLIEQAKLSLETESLKDDDELKYFIATAFYYQITENSIDDQNKIQEALSYFEQLMQTRYAQEISHAYAHLLHINHQDLKAAKYYQDLAKDLCNDEYLFQAAVYLAETDKENAYLAFQKIAQNEVFSELQKQAFYNELLLAFELKKYDEIIQSKEKFKIFEDEKLDEITLLLVQSFILTQKTELAIQELAQLIHRQTSATPSLKQALNELLEIASISKNTALFDEYLPIYEKYFQQDQEFILAKIWNIKALTDLNFTENALSKLNELSESEFFLDLIHLQQIYLSKQIKNDLQCIYQAKSFLEKFPSHEMTLFVENSLVSSLISALDTHALKEDEVIDLLQQVLKTSTFNENKNLCHFHLARILLQKSDFANAEKILQNLEAPELEGEILLLKAFFAKQAQNDNASFIVLANKALNFSHLEKGPIYLGLFNAYLESQDLKNAAYFLELAYRENVVLNEDTLLWLAEQNTATEKVSLSIEIFEKLLATNPQATTITKLANLYYQIKNFSQVITVLSPLQNTLDVEILFLLGSSYQNMQMLDLALEQYQKITSQSPFFKTKLSALACLESCKIQTSLLTDFSAENPQVVTILNSLKNLILQKNIFHEPVYLEAALDYIDLQSLICNNNPEKRLQLLTKTWQDFTSTEHVLDKDYHINRKSHPELNTIYQGFLAFIEANIDLEKAKIVEDIEEKENLIAEGLEILQDLKGQTFQKELQARAEKCLQP